MFTSCAHERLDAIEVRKKAWLKPNSKSAKALQDIVTEKRLLKDLQKLTDFCHTGYLEVFHNVLLKYAPKRQHFSYEGKY